MPVKFSKISLAPFLLLMLFSCGCTRIKDAISNSGRYEWYVGYHVDCSKLYLVKEGMTRSEVLEVWGDPWRILEDKDVWIYSFPELSKKKYHLEFKEDVVLHMWSNEFGF